MDECPTESAQGFWRGLAVVKGSDRFVLLDGLRGVAALCVMVGHSSRPFAFGEIFRHADLAVDFFFMLSGFVLVHGYRKKIAAGMSIGEFLAARLIRLYPLYFLAVLLGAAFWMSRGADVGVSLASMLVFLPSIKPLTQVPLFAYPLNIPAWTLALEMAASFLFFASVGSRTWLLVVAAISLLWLLIDGRPLNGAKYSELVQGVFRLGLSFSIGMLLYDFRRFIPKVSIGPFGAALTCVLLAMIFIAARNIGNGRASDLIVALLAFPPLILIGSRLGTTDGATKVLGALGAMSYPLYILHYPMLYVLVHVLPPRSWLIVPLMIPVMVGVSWLVLKVWDRPIRNTVSALFSSQRKQRIQG